jgi:cytoskeletal protein CcmA (bactofilin family)
MGFSTRELTMQAKTHKLQKGFTLLELSMTTVITTMIIIGAIQMQTYQATLEAARSIADMYKHVGKAADSYLANYYGQLKSLPDACSNVGWGGSTMGSKPAGPPAVGCSITVKAAKGGAPTTDVVIANGLQPTVAELEQLGLMVRAGGVAFGNQLPMPTFAGLNGNALQITDSAGTVAPAQYAVLIRRMEVAGGGTDLSSLVFNLQPYNLTNTSRSSDILLDQIVMAAGGDAFLSDANPATKGRLRGQAGTSANELDNPLQAVFNGTVQGAPYVLAIRGGFGSSGYDQFVRRDGTQTLTAAWNVGGQNITGVATLGANAVSAATGTFSGNLSAGGNLAVTGNGAFAGDLAARNGTFAGGLDVTGLGNFRGNVDVAGNVTGQNGTFRGDVKADGGGTFKGDLSANNATFEGVLKAASAKITGALEAASAKITGLLEAGSAYISGALEVAGNAILGSLRVRGATNLDGTLEVTGASAFRGSSTFTGESLFEGKATANQLKLGSQGKLGERCDSANETIRRATLDERGYGPNNVRLVVCDPNTNRWVYAVDFSEALSILTASVGTLSTTIDTVSGALATGDKNLQDQITKNTTNIATNTADIAALTTRVGTLEGSVTKLETGYKDLNTAVDDLKTYRLKWDIISVQWDRYVTAPASKVWKKTPWKCNAIGTLSNKYDVRYLQNASDNQTAGSYTMPMMVGLDTAPLYDTIVYDFNCVTQAEASAAGLSNDADYWYVGMSSVISNMYEGNSCRQGLSTNKSFSDKNYLIATQGEISKVEGGYLTGWYKNYSKVTMQTRNGDYRSEVALPVIGSSVGIRYFEIAVGSSSAVDITNVSNVTGNKVTVGSGSSRLFKLESGVWTDQGSGVGYNSNCSGSGFVAAPIGLDSYSREPMAARFIAFTRMGK